MCVCVCFSRVHSLSLSQHLVQQTIDKDWKKEGPTNSVDCGEQQQKYIYIYIYIYVYIYIYIYIYI